MYSFSFCLLKHSFLTVAITVSCFFHLKAELPLKQNISPTAQEMSQSYGKSKATASPDGKFNKERQRNVVPMDFRHLEVKRWFILLQM